CMHGVVSRLTADQVTALRPPQRVAVVAACDGALLLRGVRDREAVVRTRGDGGDVMEIVGARLSVEVVAPGHDRAVVAQGEGLCPSCRYCDHVRQSPRNVCLALVVE